MPNWVTNTFRIEASKEKISELKKKFKSKDNVFDFNKIIPMPKNSKKFQAKGGVNSDDMEMVDGDLVIKEGKPNNWYVWSLNNWGTKWNSQDAEIVNESDTHVEYCFRTAWSPPLGITKSFFSDDCDTLKGVTHVEWYCTEEFEEEVHHIIRTERKEDKP